MSKRHLLALLGIAACVMTLFPPVHTFRAPLLLEDRGIAWQMRGGTPNLVVADPGGYHNKRFAFLLSLGEGDKIVVNQLAVQLIILAMAGLGIYACKPGVFRQGNSPSPKEAWVMPPK